MVICAPRSVARDPRDEHRESCLCSSELDLGVATTLQRNQMRTGKIAYATNGKFVLNRKLLLLCFQRGARQSDDFAGFICIE
jgi:hypothetical protein